MSEVRAAGRARMGDQAQGLFALIFGDIVGFRDRDLLRWPNQPLATGSLANMVRRFQ
jgi:hypothetical protein